MKTITIYGLIVISALALGGCKTSSDSMMYAFDGKDYNQCNTCSVCSTCGYNQNYRDSGWY